MPVATTALILGGLMAAQTANSYIGDQKSAKYAKQAGETQANDALLVGNEAAQRAEAQGNELTGAQRTSFAAGGVDTTSGSAADVIANDKRLNAINVLQIRNNAAREALGLRTQASNASQSYKNRATGTLLSGAAGLYGIYDAYGKTSRPVTPRAPTSTGAQGTQGGYSGGKVSP